MFEQDYLLRGKHATYTKYLRDTANLFDRYLDVYMLGAVVGYLHNRKSEKDLSTNDTAAMLASVFIGEKDKCEFIYRLIMLMDTSTGLSADQRVDRAFRDDTNEEAVKNNLRLFNSYVLGGIEVLYEKFVDNCTTRDDYLDGIYKFVNEFKSDIDNVHNDEDLVLKMTK